MKGMTQRSKVVWALILGFLIGLFLGLFVSRAGTQEIPEPSVTLFGETQLDDTDVALSARENVTDTRQPITTDTFVEEELVHVKDQAAGSNVFVSRVELQQPGWVAIQEGSAEQPGNILGAQRFDPGVYQGTVRLLRPTKAGMTYYATLWHDNGDKLFDHTTDTALSLTRGMSFEAF